jgi:hypothetical protein
VECYRHLTPYLYWRNTGAVKRRNNMNEITNKDIMINKARNHMTSILKDLDGIKSIIDDLESKHGKNVDKLEFQISHTYDWVQDLYTMVKKKIEGK